MQVAARILQHPQSMLAMTKQEIEKKGLVIETIRQHHIQGSGIPGQRAIEESQPRRDFILPQALGLQIQRQPQRRPDTSITATCRGNLDAISLLGMNRSLEAARKVGARSWGGSHDR